MKKKSFDLDKMPPSNQTVYKSCRLLNPQEGDNFNKTVRVVKHGDLRDPRSMAEVRLPKRKTNCFRNVFDLVYIDKKGEDVDNSWKVPGIGLGCICDALGIDRHKVYDDGFLDDLFDKGLPFGFPAKKDSVESDEKDKVSHKDSYHSEVSEHCFGSSNKIADAKVVQSSEIVSISKKDANIVLNWVGFKSAGNWSLDRLASKLLLVKEVMPSGEPPEDPVVAELLKKVLNCIKDDGEFEVVEEPVMSSSKEVEESDEFEDEDDAEEEDDVEKEDDVMKDEDDEAVSEEVVDTSVEEGGEEVTEKKTCPECGHKLKAGKKKKGLHSVRPNKGRSYCAGVVLKQHGLREGVTDLMIEEVNKMVGDDNTRESKLFLSRGWHAINGFTGEFVIED